MTDGINRHKARHMSGLRSSDLSSAHPQKAPLRVAPGRARWHKRPLKKHAIYCHPVPFLWNSYMKLCFGLAGQPSRHPNNAGSLPTRFPGEPKSIIFPAAECVLARNVSEGSGGFTSLMFRASMNGGLPEGKPHESLRMISYEILQEV